jgi:hypothetical protein
VGLDFDHTGVGGGWLGNIPHDPVRAQALIALLIVLRTSCDFASGIELAAQERPTYL